MVEGVTSLYFTNVRNEPRDNATVLSPHITFCHCIQIKIPAYGLPIYFFSSPTKDARYLSPTIAIAVQRIEVQYQLTPRKQNLVF